jgi:hypothetical protein
MKIEVEYGHYPHAGIRVLRKAPGDPRKFVVVLDCCGRIQPMSRGNVLERLRTGAAYVEKHGFPTPCMSCSKTAGMYYAEKTRKGKSNRKIGEFEPIFKQIKIPDWDSRPGDRGYKLWSDGAK